MESKFKYEPKCPISLTDTKNGGIIIKPHISSSGSECKPNGVLDTTTAFDLVISNPTNIKCYICRTKITSEDFKIISKDDLIEKELKTDIYAEVNKLIENPYKFNLKNLEINAIPYDFISHTFILNALNTSITVARNVSINKLISDLGHVRMPVGKVLIDGILNLKQKKSPNQINYESQYLSICLFVNEIALNSLDFNAAFAIVVANYVDDLINQVYYSSDLLPVLRIGEKIIKDMCALEYSTLSVPNTLEGGLFYRRMSLDKIIKKYT